MIKARRLQDRETAIQALDMRTIVHHRLTQISTVNAGYPYSSRQPHLVEVFHIETVVCFVSRGNEPVDDRKAWTLIWPPWWLHLPPVLPSIVPLLPICHLAVKLALPCHHPSTQDTTSACCSCLLLQAAAEDEDQPNLFQSTRPQLLT